MAEVGEGVDGRVEALAGSWHARGGAVLGRADFLGAGWAGKPDAAETGAIHAAPVAGAVVRTGKAAAHLRVVWAGAKHA
eukprot:scaffold150155_cov39-Prasinocladus_malaysianus.AAC.1